MRVWGRLGREEMGIFSKNSGDFPGVSREMHPQGEYTKSTGSGGKKRGPAQLRVFNLGNTSPVPVSDLVSILDRLLKVKVKRHIMKLPRNGDVQFTHANISLAERELGYKPSTDLQTGLKKFVRWYLNYYSGGKKAAG
ncbi:UDP-glucuronate 4-epimerase 3-like [Carya illinoinensis]|uniref:UDP-glucuronate 4-epimerase 3-like n=1 Tax=Carya illinoinensis TaxID=32201 RepID=UPI001C71AC92|nr:UDP-glucuronate 4-epimerase 3-like [Carya illinoinensis]